MNVIKRLITGSMTMAAIALLPAAHAAYPTSIQVIADVYNSGGQDMTMTSSNWLDDASELADYAIAADQGGRRFDVILNPGNDSAQFSYATGDGKVCKFTMSHETVFSWIGLKPAPQKKATAQSVGSIAAQCSASVTGGQESLSSYSVKFSMQ